MKEDMMFTLIVSNGKVFIAKRIAKGEATLVAQYDEKAQTKVTLKEVVEWITSDKAENWTDET